MTTRTSRRRRPATPYVVSSCWARFDECRVVDYLQAGLYLWASCDEDCWATVEHLAGLGVLVAPGSFYGPSGARHVRVALTATDERVAAAVTRLAAG